jgi:type I restriction enzyme S subunit
MNTHSLMRRRPSQLMWIEDIPVEWDQTRGKRIFRQVRTPKKHGDEQLSATQKYGVVPQNQFMEQEGNRVVLALSGTDNFRHVDKDDFVISLRSFQGGIERCHYDGCVSPAYTILKKNREISEDYFGYLLKCDWFISALQVGITGIREGKNVSYEEFGDIILPFPAVQEQTAIARFLDRETGLIDGLIEKKTRFIALLNEKEKAAISRLVRRGLERNAPTTESGVDWRGRVPAHWVRGRMKDHFRQEKRQGYENLTVLSVYREFGVIEKASRDDNINKTPEDLTKYQLVKPNDLVINKMKAWQGSMGIAPMKGITSPDYVVMRPIGEHDPRYMHHYLRAQPMPWVYRLISNGIRTDQWRMEPEAFLGLPVFMPPLEEQRRIADRIDVELERIRGLIALTERSIGLLREKRAALITAAVTGKIDVRAAA